MTEYHCDPFTDHRNIFLTAVDAGKSEIKALADLVSARVRLLSHSCLSSQCAVEMIGGFPWTSLLRTISPFMASPPPKAPPSGGWGLYLRIFRGCYHFSGHSSLYVPSIYICLPICLSVIHSSLLFNLSHIHHSNVYVGICLANRLRY